MNTKTLKIRHRSGVFSISPVDADTYGLLAPLLSYQRRGENRVKTKKGIKEVGVSTLLALHYYNPEAQEVLVPQGLLQRTMAFLKDHGFAVDYTCERRNEDLSVLKPYWDEMRKVLFPGGAGSFRYMQDVILAKIAALDMGVIVAPTGYGKSFLITAVCAAFQQANVTVVSPDAALVRDMSARLIPLFGEESVGIYVTGARAKQKKLRRIMLTTSKSLYKIPNDHSDIILVDEVHRAAGEELSTALAEKQPKKIFGFTATLTGRADGAEIVTESLVGPVIEHIVYPDAVRHGIVSPMRVVFSPIPVGPASGDLTSRVQKKRKLIWRNTIRNSAIARSIQTYTSHFGFVDPQVLILVESIDHAVDLQKRLPDYEIVYAVNALRSKSKAWKKRNSRLDDMTRKKMEQMQSDFSAGRLRKVIATSVWGTGVDFPYLDIVVQASGQYSEISTLQFAGRGTRINPQKEFGLILDYADSWDPWVQRRYMQRRSYYEKLEWGIHG